MTEKRNLPDRRKFIKNAAAFSLLASALPQLVDAADPKAKHRADIREGYTFLFQGDSITDAGRSHDMDWNHVLGQGYAYLISSRLWLDHPKRKFKFFNRGVSGTKLLEMAGRWQEDALDIKPDLISILIGINDVSALIRGDATYTAERFETEYRALLQQTRQALPETQLVLGEPFVLPGSKLKDKYPEYATEIKMRQEIVKRLSVEFNAIFVAYQQLFNKALSVAPIDYWIWDGIHPMPAGHEMMAREWLRQVGGKIILS